jgi:chaperonin GroEL
MYSKPKAAPKLVISKSDRLSGKVLSTMKAVSDIVGSTLGPGGQPVLVERQQHGLGALVTKDGVTVFRSLAFDDSIAQEIMSTARDAAVRTVTEAGDGTTTATVLSEALVRKTNEYAKANPRVSPQRIVRRLQKVYQEAIEPTLRTLSRKADFTTEEGEKFLFAVAKVSANGDKELAESVIECFNLVGDDGNVTITEQSGPSKYEVEKVEGYSIPIGLQDSVFRFAGEFINDQANQRCYLEKPVFVLYHGKVNEIQTVDSVLGMIGNYYHESGFNHNVVLCAIGFSDTVMGWLATNFAHPQTINVLPLACPKTALPNCELAFLQDMAAVTGATVFNPITRPLAAATLSDFGGNVEHFESSRYRSNLVGHQSDIEIYSRVQELQSQKENAQSELETLNLAERIGKLTGGIAKLKVVGSSTGELKERRDRAEDAVCAVRGAVKHGCLPGGGWGLLKAALTLKEWYPDDEVILKVLCPALLEPIVRLFRNSGFMDDEIEDIVSNMTQSITEGKFESYDILEDAFVDPYESGLLDSTPAVVESIKNAISVSSLLGTLGGVVVFARDREIDRRESESIRKFIEDSNVEEVQEYVE